MSVSTQPIFVLSCERAGSTLLRYILDTHPDVASPAELNLGELCDALYHSTYYSLGQVGTSDEAERSNGVAGKVRQIVSALMAEYATVKGKRIWCDKSPRNLQTLEILHEVFPDARYICLHRNCMDVVHSCLEVSWYGFMPNLAPYVRKNPENLIAAMVDSWNDKTRKLLAFERANQAQCLRTTYEALVLDTVETVAALFGFLGVDFEPTLLDSVFLVRHDDGPGDDRILFSKEISKGSLGQGSKLSRTHIPAGLLEEMNGLLAELGYPEVGPDWDNAPSPFLPSETRRDRDDGVVTVDEIFERHLPELLNGQRERAGEMRAVCRVSVGGEGGGNWIVDLAQQSIRRDGGEVEADCEVGIAASDFVAIVNGRLNPMAAFDRGKIQVSGDRELVTKIGQLLFGM